MKLFAIRDAQLSALWADARRRRLPRVRRYLRGAHAAETAHLDEPALTAWVASVAARAERHGLEVEWDLCRFLALALRFGDDFDRSCDWARAILAREGDATARVDALECYARNYLTDMSPEAPRG